MRPQACQYTATIMWRIIEWVWQSLSWCKDSARSTAMKFIQSLRSILPGKIRLAPRAPSLGWHTSLLLSLTSTAVKLVAEPGVVLPALQTLLVLCPGHVQHDHDRSVWAPEDSPQAACPVGWPDQQEAGGSHCPDRWLDPRSCFSPAGSR